MFHVHFHEENIRNSSKSRGLTQNGWFRCRASRRAETRNMFSEVVSLILVLVRGNTQVLPAVTAEAADPKYTVVLWGPPRSANRSCVWVQTVPATTVAVTIVSAAILAVTTGNALTDLTTLTTMVGGACADGTSNRIFFQHTLHVQLGFTGSRKRSDDASVEPETVRFVLGVLDHGLP